jgi:hypothetical protein
MQSSDDTDSAARATLFEARAAALRERVAEAAHALAERGLKPTVARIRAALGGGSPNDLAPALKSWREARAEDPAAASQQGIARGGRIPPPIADLARELWQRALAAATLDLQYGPAARRVTAKAAEVESLRTQLNAARQHLERESSAYGELRAQAARHEAIARHALTRAEQAETRVRDLLRELGEARQKIAQFTAELKQGKPAYPTRGRHSVGQAKRVKPTSSPTRRPASRKSPVRRAKTKSKIAMGKRRKGARGSQS